MAIQKNKAAGGGYHVWIAASPASQSPRDDAKRQVLFNDSRVMPDTLNHILSLRANVSERGNLGVNIWDTLNPHIYPRHREGWGKCTGLRSTHQIPSLRGCGKRPWQSILIGGAAASKMRNQTDSNRTRHCEPALAGAAIQLFNILHCVQYIFVITMEYP